MPALTQEFPPAPGGMNVALAGQEIDDTEAQYLQDILLDRPGIARRRGPVTPAAGWATLPRKASGMAIAIDPQGNDRYAALTGTDAAGFLSVWSADKATVTDISWPHALPTNPGGSVATRYRLHSSMPALGGGTWIGTASDYGAISPLHALGYWRGGTKAGYTAGTIAFTRGSTTVTGSGTSWEANVSPGMFLFANTDDASAGTFTATLLGIVAAVNSNTSITLEKIAPYSGSAGRTYTLTSLRGFMPKVAKGRVTSATDSTTVTGGGTKFSGQGLGSGTWNIYRGSDGTWVGKVASVQSDIALTLAANAAVAMADEPYIAIRGDWEAADKSVDITGSLNKTGWLTAIYAERQWYANNGAAFDKTFRLWFSDTSDLEATDLSQDGDWIPVSSTSDIPEPIRALVPTYNALLVMKESETFAVFGTSPSSFSAKKLEDDGVLSTMSVQSFGGGAIWAGRNGIYYYDGVQVQNLTAEKLGDVWRNSIRSVDPLRHRMWSMIVRNHYFLFIEELDPTISVIKGNTAVTARHWVVVVNLESRAIALHTNIGIRGAVTLPATAGTGTLYLVNNVATDASALCSADDLFDSEGTDTLGTTDASALLPSSVTYPSATLYPGVQDTYVGPDFYFNSKKYNAGADVRLKRFKQLAIHYLAQGGSLKVDTVLGLNDIGQTLTGEFPSSVLTWAQLRTLLPNWSSVAEQYPTWRALVEGVFRPKRVRFIKKDHHLSFRLWQANSTMTRVRVGPFHIAYKLMRPQRVQ